MTKTPVQMAVEALDSIDEIIAEAEPNYLSRDDYEVIGKLCATILPTIRAALQAPVWNTDMEDGVKNRYAVCSICGCHTIMLHKMDCHVVPTAGVKK